MQYVDISFAREVILLKHPLLSGFIPSACGMSYILFTLAQLSIAVGNVCVLIQAKLQCLDISLGAPPSKQMREVSDYWSPISCPSPISCTLPYIMHAPLYHAQREWSLRVYQSLLGRIYLSSAIKPLTVISKASLWNRLASCFQKELASGVFQFQKPLEVQWHWHPMWGFFKSDLLLQLHHCFNFPCSCTEATQYSILIFIEMQPWPGTETCVLATSALCTERMLLVFQ